MPETAISTSKLCFGILHVFPSPDAVFYVYIMVSSLKGALIGQMVIQSLRRKPK